MLRVIRGFNLHSAGVHADQTNRHGQAPRLGRRTQKTWLHLLLTFAALLNAPAWAQPDSFSSSVRQEFSKQLTPRLEQAVDQLEASLSQIHQAEEQGDVGQNQIDDLKLNLANLIFTLRRERATKDTENSILLKFIATAFREIPKTNAKLAEDLKTGSTYREFRRSLKYTNEYLPFRRSPVGAAVDLGRAALSLTGAAAVWPVAAGIFIASLIPTEGELFLLAEANLFFDLFRGVSRGSASLGRHAQRRFRSAQGLKHAYEVTRVLSPHDQAVQRVCAFLLEKP